MNRRSSGASPPRLDGVFAPSAPAVDYNLLARYAADSEACTPQERAEVRRLAANDPDIAVAAGLREPDLPPPVPVADPPRSGFRWYDLVLSAFVMIASAVISAVVHRAVSEVHTPSGLSVLDSLTATENRLWLWGWYIGGGLAFVGFVGGVLAMVGRLRQWRVAIPGGLLVFAGFAGGLLVFAGFVAWSLNRAAAETQEVRGRLDGLFLNHQWVTYESPKYDPIAKTFPTAADIRTELTALREQGGFDAIITFNSDGILAEVPRIAKAECGIRAVVQGIYLAEGKDENGHPLDPEASFERQLGLLTRDAPGGRPNDYVDAYVLGHNVSNRIPIETLAGWMARLRRETGRPVSTTAPLQFYLGEGNRPFRNISDYYVPDVVGGWSVGETPGQCLSELRQTLLQVGELADKPVLLKMISFPSGGRGLKPDKQVEFFRGVSGFIRPSRGVYLSVFSGFDLPWKRPPLFDPTEEHVGLFTADLKPKPAVELLKNGSLIQNRP
jgi:hypothetical protein